MSNPLKQSEGKKAALIVAGTILIFGIGGCLAVCGVSVFLYTNALEQAQEAAQQDAVRRAEQKRDIEQTIRTMQGFEFKPPPHVDLRDASPDADSVEERGRPAPRNQESDAEERSSDETPNE